MIVVVIVVFEMACKKDIFNVNSGFLTPDGKFLTPGHTHRTLTLYDALTMDDAIFFGNGRTNERTRRS